ncbi:MAG: AbrB/MazE/SpoVT family DNA-binding domain-containing protein [Sphingomicrobium sp.]|nr:AbrB/MazE/SpoVT family DNA-binding domain-containing protein [Sphingomonadales bacterium]
MKVQIGRWGNSLAVRIPKEVADRLRLREGDELDSALFEAAIEAEHEQNRKHRRDAALKWIASRRLQLPSDYKFDRDEANAR